MSNLHHASAKCCIDSRFWDCQTRASTMPKGPDSTSNYSLLQAFYNLQDKQYKAQPWYPYLIILLFILLPVDLFKWEKDPLKKKRRKEQLCQGKHAIVHASTRTMDWTNQPLQHKLLTHLSWSEKACWTCIHHKKLVPKILRRQVLQNASVYNFIEQVIHEIP